MKLPYRCGDIFALPLGDGRFASTCIVHCEHRIVTIRVTDASGSFDVRVSDDALIERRWKPYARDESAERGAVKRPRWMPSAYAERCAAVRGGVACARRRTRRVVEIAWGDALPAPAFAAASDVTFALSAPLTGAQLEELRARVASNLCVTLGPAARASLEPLLDAGLRRLALFDGTSSLPHSDALTDLSVVGPVDLHAVANAFPRLETLTLIGPRSVDLTPLAACGDLRALSVSGSNVSGTFPQVRALALARVTGIARLDGVVASPLRTLRVDRVHDLTRLDALASCASLEQLELRGLWQFDLRDASFALDLPRLQRAEIDIGGRRKNVELYRRAAWAYPWPFPRYARAMSEDSLCVVETGESANVPRNAPHRFRNEGSEAAVTFNGYSPPAY